MNIVRILNEIRAKTEGKPVEAYNAAKAVEGGKIPELVREYIALSIVWRACTEAFWALCERIASDATLEIFWRAAALESLGATHYLPEQVAERLAYFERALALVAGLPTDNEARLYIETCVAAGKNETAGATPSLEVFSQVAAVMVTQQWFNAPGRLKAYLEALKKSGMSFEDASDTSNSNIYDLVDAFKQAEADGQATFAPSQTKYLKDAFPTLFPATA